MTYFPGIEQKPAKYVHLTGPRVRVGARMLTSCGKYVGDLSSAGTQDPTQVTCPKCAVAALLADVTPR